MKVLRTVTENLKSPWGLAPLPEGGLLVSSRDEGEIITGSTRRPARRPNSARCPAWPRLRRRPPRHRALPHVRLRPHDLRVPHDGLGQPHRPHADDEKKPSGEQLGAPDTIFKGIPKGMIHNGGRIAFGPDRMLYAGAGETGDRGRPRTRKALGGKILRMTPDGDPAPGNPFDDSVVYSYGHRNVQGLAWDDKQRLRASEFGAGHLGRAEPDQAGRQLRLAGGRGQERRPEVPQPGCPVAHGPGLAERYRLRRGLHLDGGAARPTAVAHPVEGHGGRRRPAGLPEGRVRPAAHGGPGGRRQAPGS